MNRLSRLFSRVRVKSRHAKKTLIFSPDDEPGKPSRHLIELTLDAARTALDTDLSEVSARMPFPPHWPDYWPGEHYRLLAALVRLLRPKVVVDIGTNTGLSALSLRQYLPEGGVVYTFDVLPWAGIPHTCLRREDFEDGRMIQVVADLAQPKAADAHRDKLLSAPLIFVDGPKDGVFEPAFLKNLARMPFANQAYLVFDDIKDHNMLDIWREIKEPKMDITSLGHWLGTGIVHWPAGKATS